MKEKFFYGSDFGHGALIEFFIMLTCIVVGFVTYAVHETGVTVSETLSQHAAPPKTKKLPAHHAPTPDRGMPVASNP